MDHLPRVEISRLLDVRRLLLDVEELDARLGGHPYVTRLLLVSCMRRSYWRTQVVSKDDGSQFGGDWEGFLGQR